MKLGSYFKLTEIYNNLAKGLLKDSF